MNKSGIGETSRVRMDAHAHVFVRTLPLVEGRRYTPTQDASLLSYLNQLDRYGLTHGVLVQPSFLGFDNSYLLQALASANNRLRGVAVVEPTTSLRELEAMAIAGVVGVRLNVVGAEIPDVTSNEWLALLEFVRCHEWHVEIHADAKDLSNLIPPLLKRGVKVVVDHMGRPDISAGTNDPGFLYLLSEAFSGRVWVKLSAGYRLGMRDNELPAKAAAALISAYGPERLVWGSDWPHTTFETVTDFESSLRSFESWIPNVGAQEKILGTTASQLFQLS